MLNKMAKNRALLIVCAVVLVGIIAVISISATVAGNPYNQVMNAIEKACYEMDLSKPIWLDSVVKDFQIHAKCRFTRDSFVEEVPFDYMEIQVIEEDY